MSNFDREPLPFRALHTHGVRRYDLMKPRLVRSMVFDEGKICPWWVLFDAAPRRTRRGKLSRAQPVLLNLRSPDCVGVARHAERNRRRVASAWDEYRRLWNAAVAIPLANLDDLERARSDSARYPPPLVPLPLPLPPRSPFSPWMPTP